MPNDVWGVELWGPSLVRCWSGIKDSKGKHVKAYEFDQLPEKVEEVPCALSYISADSADIDYSQGGMDRVLWKGQTEFHLTLDIRKQTMSYIWQFYRHIVKAAAASLTLGGLVDSFQIKSSGSIKLQVLQYGAETDHFGLIVYWEVYENITSKLSVGI